MSDARSLLKAKRQEARISHPYASYSASGQLRCMVCSTTIKQSSMWDGHLGSKAHRMAIMKLREAEAKAEEAARSLNVEPARESQQAKRRPSTDAERDDLSNGTKRRRLSGETASASNDASTLANAATSHSTISRGFPADFFSDPSKAPVLDPVNDDEDEGRLVPPAPVKSHLDLEWEQFQATIINAPDEEREEERRDAFARATVFAEPELVVEETGFPPNVAIDETDAVVPAEKEETEEEKRRRKEQEDRELIMDRLMEEERTQEEADSRVSLMKARVDALKQARERRRAASKQ